MIKLSFGYLFFSYGIWVGCYGIWCIKLSIAHKFGCKPYISGLKSENKIFIEIINPHNMIGFWASSINAIHLSMQCHKNMIMEKQNIHEQYSMNAWRKIYVTLA